MRRVVETFMSSVCSPACSLRGAVCMIRLSLCRYDVVIMCTGVGHISFSAEDIDLESWVTKNIKLKVRRCSYL